MSKIPTISDLELDLVDLQSILNASKRPNNQALINKRISGVQSQIKTQQELLKKQQEQSEQLKNEAPKEVKKEVQYVTMRNYSFEQTNTKAKVYLMGLDGLKNEKEVKVTPFFKEQSFSVNIENFKGKNYTFGIGKLQDKIDPEKCKIKLKSNCLLISMTKAKSDNWDQIQFKKPLVSPDVKKGGDPQAGMMDMMKNLYENGDDEMKRTIMKSMQTKDDKKGKGGEGNPMGGMGGMPGMGGMGGMPGMGGNKDKGGMPDMSKMMDMMKGMGGDKTEGDKEGGMPDMDKMKGMMDMMKMMGGDKGGDKEGGMPDMSKMQGMMDMMKNMKK